MVLPGRTLLKTAGILYIVTAALSVLLSLLVAVLDWKLLANPNGAIAVYGLAYAPLSLLLILYSGGLLFCGIYAVIHCGHEEMGARLYGIGCVLMGIQTINLIAAFVRGGVPGTALSLILATLYMIGGKRNRDALKNRRVL